MKIKSDYFNSISKVITYYEFFGYAPSISETHKFLNCNIPKPKFLQLIKGFAKKKKIIVSNNRIAFSSKIIKRSLDQEFRANRLLKQAKPLLKLFSFIPTLRLIGISGSLSMNQLKKNDDLDLFVITKGRYIWLTRFAVLLLKKFLSYLMIYPAGRLCFNLFFSQPFLTVPKNKQNLYIGHEILQLKIITDKDKIYDDFLYSNKWIKKFFPNVHIITDKIKNNASFSERSIHTHGVELLARKIQIWWLKKTGYRYKEHLGQIWLFQEDFQDRIKKFL